MRIKVKIMRKAFTLIELLVVVAIIGVLATVIMVSVGGAKASSRYAKTLAEMTDMAKAVNIYKGINGGVYPDGWYGGPFVQGQGDAATFLINNNLTDPGANRFLVDYMGGKIPTPDCTGGKYAFYRPIIPGKGYVAIMYFSPVNPSNVAAKYPIEMTAADIAAYDIRLKVTKKITCKETAGTGADTDFMK